MSPLQAVMGQLSPMGSSHWSKNFLAPFLLSVGMNLEFRPDLVNNVHFNVVLVEL